MGRKREGNNKPKRRTTMTNETMVKYNKGETLVLIKADNSFVIVGEGNVTDQELLGMKTRACAR